MTINQISRHGQLPFGWIIHKCDIHCHLLIHFHYYANDTQLYPDWFYLAFSTRPWTNFVVMLMALHKQSCFDLTCGAHHQDCLVLIIRDWKQTLNTIFHFPWQTKMFFCHHDANLTYFYWQCCTAAVAVSSFSIVPSDFSSSRVYFLKSPQKYSRSHVSLL